MTDPAALEARMARLEHMLAEREIERLLLDYAALNDAGEWDALAALFLPEGRMNRPTAPEAFVEGRKAILEAFRARPVRISRHIVANMKVTVSGDEATASSQILLFTGAGTAPLVGSYRDRLRRTGQGWRFAERWGSLDFS